MLKSDSIFAINFMSSLQILNIKHLSDIFLFNSQKLSSQLVLLTNFTGEGIAA